MSNIDVLSGQWTYRSFFNKPEFVTDSAEKALGLFFAEAVFTFDPATHKGVTGRLDWPGGGLDLKGNVRSATPHAPLTLDLVGTGRAGTDTEGWEYDYAGFLAHEWPNGVDQVAAIVGTVIRAKPHGGAPAGFVASFIAVKHPPGPPASASSQGSKAG